MLSLLLFSGILRGLDCPICGAAECICLRQSEEGSEEYSEECELRRRVEKYIESAEQTHREVNIVKKSLEELKQLFQQHKDSCQH